MNYVLYRNRSAYTAKSAEGTFNERDLLAYACANGLSTNALVMSSGMFPALSEAKDVPALQSYFYPISTPRPAYDRKPDTFFGIELKAWGIGMLICGSGFAVLFFLLRNEPRHIPTAPVKSLREQQEDQLVKDAVTLQRRIDAQDKQFADKVRKEYERQERNGQ